MRKIVFASHGQFASGLKSAVDLIIGDMAKDIVTFDLMPTGSAEDFVSEVTNIMIDERITEIIVLTDLKGASVCNSFTLISLNPKIHVFSGMNLPLALDLILSFPKQLNTSDIEQIIDNGRQSIDYIKLIENESEEF